MENIAKDPQGLHDVHGPWEHQGLTGQYTLYNAGTSLLSSEFGVEGMTNLYVLQENIQKDHQWPPSRDNEFYFHRGSWWNNYPLLQESFDGKLSDIETAVKASQFMQYEGLKYAVEANRRRALACSGTFPWQFNEPYPNNTCTCSVDYYASPKPVYYGIRTAYGPETVTARFDSQTLKGRDAFCAQLFWQSSFGDRTPEKVLAYVVAQDGTVCAQKEFFCKDLRTEAEKAACVGTICCPAQKIETGVFYLALEALDAAGAVLAKNRYCFTKTDLSQLLSLPKARIETRMTETQNGCMLEVENTGTTAAAGLWLEDADALEGEEKGYLYFSENYFYLFPGEKKTVRITGTKGKPVMLRISGFNVEG